MNDRIDNNYQEHNLKPDGCILRNKLTDECKKLAHCIDWHCPDGREKSVALTKIEEAMFWANAAISRHKGNQIPE